MAEVSKVCRIAMDTAVESAMHVHRADGTLMPFQEYKSGLYFYDAADSRPNPSSKTKDAYLFLHTVAGNKASYARREIEGADQARDLYQKLGHPSEQEFNKILQNNFLRNYPLVTPGTPSILSMSETLKRLKR
jgi:hypothetical protein